MIKVLLNITAAELEEVAEAAQTSTEPEHLMMEVTESHIKLFQRSGADKGTILKFVTRSHVMAESVR